MTTATTTTVTTADAANGFNPFVRRADLMLGAMTRQGWQKGAPVNLAFEARAVDQDACAAMQCGACGTRGLAYRPMHRAFGGYRVVCECPACGAGEEL